MWRYSRVSFFSVASHRSKKISCRKIPRRDATEKKESASSFELRASSFTEGPILNPNWKGLRLYKISEKFLLTCQQNLHHLSISTDDVLKVDLIYLYQWYRNSWENLTSFSHPIFLTRVRLSHSWADHELMKKKVSNKKGLKNSQIISIFDNPVEFNKHVRFCLVSDKSNSGEAKKKSDSNQKWLAREN